MKIAIIKFPGSHGADDVLYAYQTVLKQEAYLVWHREENLREPNAVVIPGGFSFGDYLRPGALAKASPVIGALRRFADDRGPLLGIGNGFQLLCELGILPGALLTNSRQQFVNKQVFVKVESTNTPFLKETKPQQILRLPLVCYHGFYFADPKTLKDLEDGGQVALRYCDAEGEVDVSSNPTGAMSAIAGVINRHRNVLGVMVHPERAVEALFGNTDGLYLLKSVLSFQGTAEESSQGSEGQV